MCVSIGHHNFGMSASNFRSCFYIIDAKSVSTGISNCAREAVIVICVLHDITEVSSAIVVFVRETCVACYAHDFLMEKSVYSLMT